MKGIQLVLPVSRTEEVSVDFTVLRVSLTAQLVKNLPAMHETTVRFLGREDLLEKG